MLKILKYLHGPNKHVYEQCADLKVNVTASHAWNFKAVKWLY